MLDDLLQTYFFMQGFFFFLELQMFQVIDNTAALIPN